MKRQLNLMHQFLLRHSASHLQNQSGFNFVYLMKMFEKIFEFNIFKDSVDYMDLWQQNAGGYSVTFSRTRLFISTIRPLNIINNFFYSSCSDLFFNVVKN